MGLTPTTNFDSNISSGWPAKPGNEDPSPLCNEGKGIVGLSAETLKW